MAGKPTPIPHVTSQPPSVDFIQNCLPSYHKAFENQYCQYDPVLQRFVPLPEVAKMPGQHRPTEGGNGQGLALLPVRQPTPVLAAMNFWTGILPESMARLTREKVKEPQKVRENGLSLRGKSTWDEIYPQLQIARERYDGTKEGRWGRFKAGYRRIYRRSGDHADAANRVCKLIPDHAVVSPVKAAVEVLIDAIKVAADVREKITSAFDGGTLEKTFGDVEIFLGTFREDQNIKKASVDLVFTVLSAVEDAMEFFLTHQVQRAFESVTKGGNYQKPLLDGIDKIQKKSEDLIHEANRSETVGNREAMQKIIQGIGQIVYLEDQQGQRVEFVLDQVDVVIEGVTDVKVMVGDLQSSTADFQSSTVVFQAELMNKVEGLCLDGAEARKREEEAKEEARKRDEEHAKDISVLLGEIKALKQSVHETPSHHPSRQGSPQPLPPSQQQWLPMTAPVPGTWPLPPPFAPFPPPWNYPPVFQHQQPYSTPAIDAAALRRLLDIPDLDRNDIDSILESSEVIPIAYRNRASQIVGNPEFRSWATSATSRQLLVQGDLSHDMLQSAGTLSLVCATLTKGLRAREQFVCLAFFCGNHTEPDEHPGGGAMMRSLIAQLLERCFSTSSFQSGDVDVEAIKDGNIKTLCGLFGSLVRHLPAPLTLVCVLDGVGCYENAEYEAKLMEILGFLVGLVKDGSVAPAVKILLTSQTQTDRVNTLFDKEDEDLVQI